MPLMLFGHKKASSRVCDLIYCGESGTERAAAGGAVADQYEAFSAVDHPQTYPFSRSRLVLSDDAPAVSGSLSLDTSRLVEELETPRQTIANLERELAAALEDNNRLTGELETTTSALAGLRSSIATSAYGGAGILDGSGSTHTPPELAAASLQPETADTGSLESAGDPGDPAAGAAPLGLEDFQSQSHAETAPADADGNLTLGDAFADSAGGAPAADNSAAPSTARRGKK